MVLMASTYTPTLFYKGEEVRNVTSWLEHFDAIWDGFTPNGPTPPHTPGNYTTHADLQAVKDELYAALNAADLSNTPGPPGPSAYQVAVANGFVGTADQWLASLVGPPGTGSSSSLVGGTDPLNPDVFILEQVGDGYTDPANPDVFVIP